MHSRRPQQGLTLLEVIVALLALGLMIAIAVPSWQQHRIRLHRVDARTELLSIAGRLIACHARLGAYNNDACTVALPVSTAAGTYRLSGEVTADSFRLTAQPLGEQEADRDCGSFLLDERAHRGVTGQLAPVECWKSLD
jgi:type IV pilus assembly protein PilE